MGVFLIIIKNFISILWKSFFMVRRKGLIIIVVDNVEFILGVDYILIKCIGLFLCIKFIEF